MVSVFGAKRKTPISFGKSMEQSSIDGSRIKIQKRYNLRDKKAAFDPARDAGKVSETDQAVRSSDKPQDRRKSNLQAAVGAAFFQLTVYSKQ